MKQIIINADDFGVNKVVTSEIERLILDGKISSTTVMANGECLDEVKSFASEHPEISFGVHLCLSEFKSITNSKGLFEAGLIDENGYFIKKKIFELHNLNDKFVKQAIYDELTAQIGIVSSLGFPISHADSHHHVHTISPLRDVFCQVFNDRGIQKVRLGSGFRTIQLKAHIFQWIERNKLNRFYRSAFSTTDSFYSLAEFFSIEKQNPNEHIVELMCHPGHPGSQYRKEIDMLEKMSMNKIPDIKLITYNDLL